MIFLRAIRCTTLALLTNVAIDSALVSAGPPETTNTLSNSLNLAAVPPSPVQDRGPAISANSLRDAGPPQTSVSPTNPLRSIPIASLTATREKPIFSPLRRPPSVVQRVQPPLAIDQPPRPRFSLVGAVAGESEGIAIVLDETTKVILRLRTGESHLGWTLRKVSRREVTLENGRETIILDLATPAAR
jgi:hypothetical protein